MDAEAPLWATQTEKFLKKFKASGSGAEKASKSYPFLFDYVEDPEFRKDLIKLLQKVQGPNQAVEAKTKNFPKR